MSIESLVMWQGYLLALVIAAGCWFKSRGARRERKLIQEAIMKFCHRDATIGGGAMPWMMLHEVWDLTGATMDEWFVRCDKRVVLSHEELEPEEQTDGLA